MKKCPVCGTKYSNEKEFCELDRALLVECEDEETKKEEQPIEPFNKKRFWTACAFACGFIAFIMLLYYFIGGGFSR